MHPFDALAVILLEVQAPQTRGHRCARVSCAVSTLLFCLFRRRTTPRFRDALHKRDGSRARSIRWHSTRGKHTYDKQRL
jgi:hypothetical protein